MANTPEVIKQIYPTVVSPENLTSLKKCLKILRKIAVVLEDKEIALTDIVCQDAEEYLVLQEYRRKMNVLKKELSKKALKKLFH